MIEKEDERRDAGMYERAYNRIQGRSEPAATPERTPQREDSGRFATTERPTGREAEERAAGYTPLKEDRDDPEGLTVRDASNERAKELQSKPIEVHESGLDENITLSVEQAAKRIEESREADTNQAELDATKSAQKAVDDLRSEKPETEPRQPQVEAEPDNIETVLKNPKIAKALQERVDAAETQRQHFETSVHEVGKMRIAALAADFPELMQLPLDKWASAINALGQTDLPRAQKIAARLHSVGEVENTLIQLKAQKDASTKAEMVKYSAKETARFRELTKHIPHQQMEAIKAEVPAMLTAVGVTDPQSFLKAIEGQSVFPRASAEMIMVLATRNLMMQKAAKAQPTRTLPTVQRPGVAAPRVNPASADLKSLNAKLSQTGHIKDAAKLLAASRASAKRGR